MRELVYKIEEFYQKHKLVVLLGVLIVLALLPFVFTKSYILGVFCRMLLYATLAGSLNAINGYSGQTCIGHAGFFCIGAYTEAILATRLGVPFWVALVAGGVVTAVFGGLVALPTLKMKGVYLSIVTLGFSEIVRLVALNWEPVTGGPMGIKGIPVPTFFGMEFSGSRTYYYIFLFIAVLFLFITNRIIKSRMGRAWVSIREDELAAKSLGVQISRYKAVNFMYGAFWAGIAGAAYAPYVRFIDSIMFSLDEGFSILSMVIVGGQGTLIGPVIGSAIINGMTEFLRPIGQWRMVAYGLLIIVMMWWRPQGLVGASDSILAGNKANKKSAKKQKKGGSK